MSNLSQFAGGGGPLLGASISFTPATFYPPRFNIGSQEFLAFGNLIAYTSTYSPIVTNFPLFGTTNVEANANVLLAISNTNQAVNWANTLQTGFINPYVTSVSGIHTKVEKSNTDFLMIQLKSSMDFTGTYVAAYKNVTAANTTVVFKYGSNIANLATGNSNTAPLYGLYGAPGSGFNDVISYNGRVIVVGGNVVWTDLGANAGSGNDVQYQGNGTILQTNTNTFSVALNAGFSGLTTYDYSVPNYGTGAWPSGTANAYVYTGIASNGNHIVVHTRKIAQSNACIVTSTDGVTWTGRTMSGAPANVAINRVTYSNSANCYIFVSPDCNVYTSTDGYTLTTRTSPVVRGSITGTNVATGQSCYSATSNSNTFIVINANTLFRTSNGVSFSRIDMDLDANLRIFRSGAMPFISYVNNKFFLMETGGRTVYSDDDGATWKLDWTKNNANTLNVELGYTTYIGMTVHNSSVYCVNYSSTNVLPINLTSSLLQATPQLVGSGPAFATSGGYYTRIR